MNCKTCTKCGESKPLEAFYTEKRGKHGRRAKCKACMADWKTNEARREWYRRWCETNPEKRAKYSRDYDRRNPEKRANKARRWAQANPEKVKEKTRKAIESLAPDYVARTLHIRIADLTPELLALKREQLETHRLAKQVKQQLKESTK